MPIRIDHASGGAVHVGPTRVTLEIVLGTFRDGATPEEIVARFDTLRLADVYAAIAHYLRHRAEFDAYLDECGREFERLRERALSIGQAGLKDRFLTRLAAEQVDNAPLPG